MNLFLSLYVFLHSADMLIASLYKFTLCAGYHEPITACSQLILTTKLLTTLVVQAEQLVVCVRLCFCTVLCTE